MCMHVCFYHACAAHDDATAAECAASTTARGTANTAAGMLPALPPLSKTNTLSGVRVCSTPAAATDSGSVSSPQARDPEAHGTLADLLTGRSVVGRSVAR